MSSSPSTSLRLELMSPGDKANTWGTITNDNLGKLLEQAICGYTTVNIGTTDHILTPNLYTVDEARSAVLNITSGTLTTSKNIVAPSVPKTYIVKNSTSGGQAIIFKTSVSTGISIPNGRTALLYYNGSDFEQVVPYYAETAGTALIAGTATIATTATTATTATNQSGGSVNATTGTFSGMTSFPATAGNFEIKTGTGDGASATVYNTAIRAWWGIGFRDYTDSATVKAYIDTRTGIISSCGGGPQDETRIYSSGTTSEIRFGGTTTTNGAARITYDRSNAALEFFTGTAATPTRRMAMTNVGMYVDYLAGTGTRTVTASASGLLVAASDSRLKTEVFTTLPSLAEVLQLKTHAYKWNEDIDYRGDEAAIEIGFFADETVNVIPSSAPMNANGYYGFNDRPIIAALVKAVQELSAKVTALEAK